MSLEGATAEPAVPMPPKPHKAHADCPICHNRVNCARDESLQFVIGGHAVPGSMTQCRGVGMAPVNLRNPGYI